MADADRNAPPLAGIRVLDLSRILAGPLCGMVLGDLGADVVKVENPDGGDDTRAFGPPFENGESAYFMAFNRNKRGLVADLKTADGREIVRALARVSDVLIENFRTGTMARFGLALESLRAETPRLITVSISGYGREGPNAERAGYDFMIQAESGLMSVTGEADGPPTRVGISIADMITGANAVQAVLAALYARERPGPQAGRGQHIDMALLDNTVAGLTNIATAYLMDRKPPGRHGNAHPAVAPYQPFATSDEPLVLAVAADRQFKTLAALIGREDLLADPRFRTNGERAANRAALEAELEAVFMTDSRDNWLRKLWDVGLPAGAIRTVDGVLEDPEAEARGLVADVPHPALGTARILASPLRFSETPVAAPFHPPTLGEHTVEVLTDLLGWAKADAEEYAARLAAATGDG